MENKYSLSSFYNDHEDQGMRACVCGEVLVDSSLSELLEELVDEISDFSQNFDLQSGTWSVEQSDDGSKIFIDWDETGNDRCFGFEIEIE